MFECEGPILKKSLWWAQSVSMVFGVSTEKQCVEEVAEAVVSCFGLNRIQPSRTSSDRVPVIHIIIFLCGVFIGIILVPTSGFISAVRDWSLRCDCNCCGTRKKLVASRVNRVEHDDSAEDRDIYSLSARQRRGVARALRDSSSVR